MDGQSNFPLWKRLASHCRHGLLVNPDAREIIDAPEGVHEERLNVYRRIE